MQQCHSERQKVKESAVHRPFLRSLFTPTPCLLLPKSCFDSGCGQGSSLSIGSPAPSGNTRGTRRFPQLGRGTKAFPVAALGSPGRHMQASLCSTRCRCCATFVPPALLPSLGKAPPFPSKPQRECSRLFPREHPTPPLTVLDRFLLLKHQPGREVPTFCSRHSSPCVNKCPWVLSCHGTQPGHAGLAAAPCNTSWDVCGLCPVWTLRAGLPS